MPLVQSLLRLAEQRRTSWHMPGHAGGRGFPDWLQNALVSLDVTELPLTDDLNMPAGPARQAMELAAAAFGAGLTRFITGGSTAALQIMLAMTIGRGGQLLLPRHVHQSVVHTAALLDFDLIWLESEDMPDPHCRFNMLPLVTPEHVERALTSHPDCQAVLLTSPDYYGYCLDLRSIAEITRRHGTLLLIDEAHGAHFAFGRGRLPAGAMASGADAAVQSGHKTLPVLTPGAMLHISAGALEQGRITIGQVDRFLPVFQTSSPSFPIAATLDFARDWLEREGSDAIQKQLSCLGRFRHGMPPGLICSPLDARPDPHLPFRRDPLRLVLALQDKNRPGAARLLARALSGSGIDVEFADLSRIVLIPSLSQTQQDWLELADALTHLTAKAIEDSPVDAGDLETEWRHWLKAAPDAVLTPGEALFGRHRQILVEAGKAAGRVSARSVLPYPPGIPLVWPGERLDGDRVDFLTRLSENKINVSGNDKQGFWVLA